MSIATALAGWSLWWVLHAIDPTRAGAFGYFLFYATLFLTLVGVFAIVGLMLRNLFRRDELVFRHVVTAFRQAIFYSALVVGMLWLRTQGLLTWWNAGFLIGALTLLEFFALSLRRNSSE